ncbi:MAG: hypothetical protein QXR74_07310 [Candidatus Bathyarchaeia archaeon]
MGLSVVLASIAARGGLRVGFTVLIISLLTGSIVGLHSLASSYSSHVAELKELQRPPLIAVYGERIERSVEVHVSRVEVEGLSVLVVWVNDLQAYMKLHNAKLKGEVPGVGEALVGEGLEALIGAVKPVVEGLGLKPSGYVSSKDYLAYSLIVKAETAKTLGLSGVTLYEAQPGLEGSLLIEAPALQMLIRSVFKEVLGSLNLVSLILLSSLALACFFQGYNASLESRATLRVLALLGASKIAPPLATLSLILSVASVFLGYCIGVFASASLSAFASMAFNTPYLKPTVSLQQLHDVGFALSAAFPSLLLGLLRGYSVSTK